jgi:predicted CXXCH cytochrome family protein
MVQSSCYVNSEDDFTCTDCHIPHVSRKETPQNRFNRLCFKCHTGMEQACTEDPSVLREAENNCVLCHMRSGETRDIPHVRTHDHKISVPPSPEEQDGIRQFKGLISINNPSADPLQKARGYLLEYESFHADPAYLDSVRWYLNKVGDKGSDIYFNTRVNYFFLKQDYNAIREGVAERGIRFVLDSLLNTMEYSNYDAWTAYRIGQSYENTGNFLLSGYFYQKATELAPFILEFQNHYGSQLVKTGDLLQAVRIFEFILGEDPRYARAYVNLGYIRVKQNQRKKGKELYKKALSLEPDNHQALLNLAAVHYLEGNKSTAERYINRLLTLDPENEQAKQLKLQLSAPGKENLNP